MFEFIVFGEPQQKGSMRAFMPKGWTRPVLTSTNRNLKAWEELVRARANEARGDREPMAGPVALSIDFYFQRPKRLLTKSTAGVWQPHISAPDLSKLVRGLEDALSGILFLDDRQVAKLDATKAYAAPGAGSSCRVTVREHYPAQLQFGEPPADLERPQSRSVPVFVPATAERSPTKRERTPRADVGF